MNKDNFLKKMRNKQLLKKIALISCTTGCLLMTGYFNRPVNAASYDINSTGYEIGLYQREWNENITKHNDCLSFYNYNNGAKLSLLGDVKIDDTVDTYALLVNASSNSSSGTNYLEINTNNKAQIDGDLYVYGENSIGENHGSAEAVIDLSLNNSQSYFAGNMMLEGAAERTGIVLTLKNGGTWYPSGASYNISTDNYYGRPIGFHLNILEGGVVDIYHKNPLSIRTTLGERSFSLNNTGASVNNATFVMKSDIENNVADLVYLHDVTGSNTYYVQIAYDDVIKKGPGTYNATNDIVLLKAGATDSVSGKAYTTTNDYNAGLISKISTITPTLETNGTDTKLTALKVEEVSADGPAQILANLSNTSAETSLSAWRVENNDLLRRMGDLRLSEGNAGVWARIYGGETKVSTSLDSNTKYQGLQIGYDKKIDVKEGKLFTGIALSHVKGNSSFDNGSGDSRSTMFGVYGSYLGEKGHFVDSIIKYGKIKNKMDINSNSVLYESDSSANGLNMSLEYGYHKELAKDSYIEPQVEINYGHINSNSYRMKMNGANGAYVNDDAINSFIGRIGINIGRKTTDGNVYAKLSVLREFNGDVGVTTNDGTYTRQSSEDFKDTWAEYGIGFNKTINSDNNIYGEITKTIGADKVKEKWKANIGFRKSF